jgi:hypothetical protein
LLERARVGFLFLFDYLRGAFAAQFFSQHAPWQGRGGRRRRNCRINQAGLTGRNRFGCRYASRISRGRNDA